MRDPMQAVMGALERDVGGVAIIWCPDLGLRDWLVGEVESVATADAQPFRTSSVEEAIASPTRMALLVPANEREVVLDLDGSRDLLHHPDHPRSQPIVLFLLRMGEGKRVLATEAISLSSWLAGNEADPEALAQIDVAAEQAAFEGEVGVTLAEWLSSWRSERLPQTGENLRRAYHAMVLEGDREGVD
jgi:hypothetical protein